MTEPDPRSLLVDALVQAGRSRDIAISLVQKALDVDRDETLAKWRRQEETIAHGIGDEESIACAIRETVRKGEKYLSEDEITGMRMAATLAETMEKTSAWFRLTGDR